MEPDRRQVGIADHPVEGAAHEVRVQGAAVLAGEDETGVLPDGRVRHRLCPLLLPVGAEHLDGAGGERDDSLAVGLRCRLLGDPAELHDLARDDDLPVLQVDVDPRQADGLASAKAAERDEVEQGVEPIVGDRVEEGSGLRRGPDRHHGRGVAAAVGGQCRAGGVDLDLQLGAVGPSGCTAELSLRDDHLLAELSLLVAPGPPLVRAGLGPDDCYRLRPLGCQLQNTENVLGRGMSLEDSIAQPRYGYFEFDLASMTITDKIQTEPSEPVLLDEVEAAGQPLKRASYRWEGHAYADIGYWAAIGIGDDGTYESVVDPRLPGLSLAG